MSCGAIAPPRRARTPASAGFAPIAGKSARLLIIGTLPGRMSLARGEYYAQPRNAFWRIMGELFGAGPVLAYGERLRRLVAQRVAVWDVCESAGRPGSLDSAICVESIVPNDFAAFFKVHRRIEIIGFNGLHAQALYNRLVRPGLTKTDREIEQLRLPSTSPAYASMSHDRKLASWSRIRERRERTCA